MNLLFRADANPSIATGHIMRCLALAQAWKDDGGDLTFASAETTPALAKRLIAENATLQSINAPAGGPEDARQTVNLARDANSRWVVIDGYQFTTDYQDRIKQAGLKLLVIDDLGSAHHYYADLILNQNLHATDRLYASREDYTRLLLGPRFSLLRREFRRGDGWKRNVSSDVRRIVLTMGGSDPDDVTSRLLACFAQRNFVSARVTVLIGGSNPRRAELTRLFAELHLDADLITDADDMPSLLASADLAISGAGTTCWEMCLLGLPSILVELAPNQHEIGARLHDAGAAIFLGRSQDVSPESVAEQLGLLLRSPEIRKQMSANAQRIVDGKGVERVLSFLRHEIRLRRTREDDCRMFWEWANDPEVRAMSFCSEPVSWESHVGWFVSRQKDPSSLFYVATDQNSRPVGQVRYQLERDRAVLSISISPELRGKGFGKTTLLAATEELFQDSHARAIDAFVKPENRSSLRLFESAGFKRQGLAQVHGQPAVHFALAKNGVA
jgi:UDP-2,4-diacetamido-2,4,6-trideoxy-beta-L-altropyranose hydrolase